MNNCTFENVSIPKCFFNRYDNYPRIADVFKHVTVCSVARYCMKMFYLILNSLNTARKVVI